MIQIHDVDSSRYSDLAAVCVPFLNEASNHDVFQRGVRAKNGWLDKVQDSFGCVGKIAYFDGTPAGMIQFVPRPSEKVVEITCVFVVERLTRMGIGRRLVESVKSAMGFPQKGLEGRKPSAIITWAFDVVGWYSQRALFEKCGFVSEGEDTPLVFSMTPGFRYHPPSSETSGWVSRSTMTNAVLVHDPSCPFCDFCVEKWRTLISAEIPDIGFEVIDKGQTSETRILVDFCALNDKRLGTVFSKDETVKREIREAISFEG